MQGDIILESGEVVNGLDYIHDTDNFTYYTKLKKDANADKIFCNKCKKNVGAYADPRTKYKFVKHKYRSKNKCDNFEYTKNYEDMKRAIYRGEQSKHRELKECIYGYIEKDTERFCNVVSEEFCFSETEKYSSGQRKRRKPDIMARHKKNRKYSNRGSDSLCF